MSIIWTNNANSQEVLAWLLPDYDVSNPPDFANDPNTPDFVKDLLNNNILSLYYSDPDNPGDLWRINFPNDHLSNALSISDNYMVMNGTTYPMDYLGVNYFIYDKATFETNYTENP